MNAEKELLLALLIEKYGSKPIAQKPANPEKPKSPRKFKNVHHKWTTFEKEKLVQLRRREMGWAQIAVAMGKDFTAAQCHSMYWNILVANKAVK
jgi:hypothetical protein